MNLKKWQRSLNGELTLILILAGILVIGNILTGYTMSNVSGFWLSIVIIAGLLALNFTKYHYHRLQVFTRWLDIVILPPLLAIIWSAFFAMLYQKCKPKIMIIILMIMIYLILFLPVIALDYGSVTNMIARLLSLVYLYLVILAESEMVVDFIKTSIFNTIFGSGFIAALVSLIIIPILGKRWHFGANPNLSWTKKNGFSWPIFIILFLLTSWFIFWNTYCGEGNNLVAVLFKIDWQPLRPAWSTLFSSLEASLFEESLRYMSILALIAGLARSKYRAEGTILISAVIFGLLHLTNFGFQKLDATVSQVIFAFAFGLLMAAIYLYTGQLWLPMLFHFAADFLSTSMAGGVTPMTCDGDINDWLNLLVLVAVPTLLTLWLMQGKRKQVIEANIERLLK